jgi:hypothetical protein
MVFLHQFRSADKDYVITRADTGLKWFKYKFIENFPKNDLSVTKSDPE